MTEKIYLSPIASATVDAKIKFLMDIQDISIGDIEDNLELRDVQGRNDLGIETTEDAPYAE